jgi:cardiolipin synthase A/B
MHWFAIYVGLGWITRLLMAPVILRRQFTPGASIAWLGIIFLHPYIGLGLYLLVGETRLGANAAKLHEEIVAKFRPPADPANTSPQFDLPVLYQPMMLQAQKIGRFRVVGGNSVQFITDSNQFIDRLVADIDAAKSHVHMLFYIFAPDASGQRVAQALIAAKGRGVKCRVLADAFASRSIFGSGGLAAKLNAAGVQVVKALPSSPLRRRDLRNHRKLAVMDGAVGYMGSQNIIDADYGGRRGAPWVDLMVRVEGRIVNQLVNVFAGNWAFETGEFLEVAPADSGDVRQGTAMQLAPTGPVVPQETYRKVLLAAVQSARERLILTTPYFVPDEPTLVALTMAADRGVKVTLILPNRPDHFFTAAAGRAHFSILMQSGVSIHLYRPGLMHSKTATVDDAFALIGSANLDVRSFNLNFELTLLLYGKEVTGQARDIQLKYLADSDPVDAKQWAERGAIRRYSERAITLLSPLL